MVDNLLVQLIEKLLINRHFNPTGQSMAGWKDLILIKDTSNCPTTPENTNIKIVPLMREQFKYEVGLLDNTMQIAVCLASARLGLDSHWKVFPWSLQN